MMTKRMKEFKARILENQKSERKIFAAKEAELDYDEPFATQDQIKAAEKFFKELSQMLEGRYEIVGSCNQDISRYLIPIGTEDQVTYYGKPDFSFRISDHWNWFSNLKKCSDPNYIQCNSADMPPARDRLNEGKASIPVKGLQVAIQGTDGKYHHVYGYKYDAKTKSFSWVAAEPADICRKFGIAT